MYGNGCVTIGNIIVILLKCIVKYGRMLDEKFGSRWMP
jgi:hypothetical protein